ncbi:unnamed protein product [Zymoseptoria tritici ST99CH_1A5]|uniref:F-box domain-containing protein n=1 Tax=Zymoseptoria tritici ST99CH_1A5 TaxID=1276529 RepID=A0A1Y6LDM5_ZYMTR|nr:unnamed protein product [Zymoseptoria tritici ST99CH_3D1]SMY20641.1 unnamed protein product [Zymoseptoria tritici ST99CH_1A5]
MNSNLGVLARLPAEIRTLVFEFTVTAEQFMTFRLDTFQREYYVPATQPALTRVSRRVRSESLPLFYECNDFVLHTESPQTLDARKWLEHYKTYLPLLRTVSLWVRHVPAGAFQFTIKRTKRHEPWQVDDGWKWITVVRKPPELARDADFVLEKLRELVSTLSENGTGPEEYFGMITQLRKAYVQMKAG